jgi:dTDP-4-amino-4,6-dideoxygalactose transaminase
VIPVHVAEAEPAIDAARAVVAGIDLQVGGRRPEAPCAFEQVAADAPGVNPPFVREGCKHSYWQYPITIDQSALTCTPTEFAQALSAEGIGAGVGYIGKPIYMSSIFQEHRVFGDTGCPFTCPRATPREYTEEDCPNTMEILKNIIVLACNEFYTDQEIEDYAKAINKVAKHYARG